MASANKKPKRKYQPKSDKISGIKPIPVNISVETEQEIKICDDIELITFDKFLKCIVNNDLSVLVISGKPSENAVFLAWISILSAHYKLIKSNEQLKYIKLVAKIESYNLKINIVTALVAVLRLKYDAKLCECLKGWKFKLEYTQESLESDLDRTLLELQNTNFKLEQAKLDYNNLHKNKKTKGEAPTKDSYMKILYAIEKHRELKYRLKPAEITLYEFDLWYNELMEYAETMKQERDKLSSKSKR